MSVVAKSASDIMVLAHRMKSVNGDRWRTVTICLVMLTAGSVVNAWRIIVTSLLVKMVRKLCYLFSQLLIFSFPAATVTINDRFNIIQHVAAIHKGRGMVMFRTLPHNKTYCLCF
jgi:hypothetical protein